MCAAAFGFVFAFLALRLGVISMTPTDAIRTAAATATAEDPDRREIVDRNGVLLAVNLPMRALEIAGAEVWSPSETASAIASVFPDVDAAGLEEKLADKRYVEIEDRLTPAQEEAVFALGLTGVRFSPRTRRLYPQGSVGAHVIGHMEKGKGGVMGLEYVLNNRREKGPLVASIDIRAQQILEEELSASLKKFHAKAAFGAVMDVATGEILALASLPDFDPNAPGAAPADFAAIEPFTTAMNSAPPSSFSRRRRRSKRGSRPSDRPMTPRVRTRSPTRSFATSTVKIACSIFPRWCSIRRTSAWRAWPPISAPSARKRR